jgi:hypothetical protein
MNAYEWDDAEGPVSAIKTLDTDVKLASPAHPILRGVSPFHLREEFYYRLHFRKNDERLSPILQVPVLSAVPEE